MLQRSFGLRFAVDRFVLTRSRVCIYRFERPELRKRPGVGLVLRCNGADWLRLGLVNPDLLYKPRPIGWGD